MHLRRLDSVPSSPPTEDRSFASPRCSSVSIWTVSSPEESERGRKGPWRLEHVFSELDQKCRGKLQPVETRLVLVDGFAMEAGRTDYRKARYLHGGASPWDVLNPLVVLYRT